MPRLFFGLEIPAQIKTRLLEVRAEVPGAKWQSVEQMHLTLSFLGDVEEERLTAVCEAARHIPQAPFELSVLGLGCFGQACAPRNLWASVQPVAPVASLHNAIKGQMESLGLTTASRAFRPHITLSRFTRQPGSVEGLLAEYGETAFGSFQVDQFVVFESKQGSGGSVYTVIKRFPSIGL
ncbi:RNA 2',3'-cyclic phosphodiesterase [Marinobacter sp.]|uniref:RNA 2',3'-cyclic phosphodiesterase n=1 Tax=Marinobacter sp. TaxID=50741 RepID=UPI003A952034